MYKRQLLTISGARQRKSSKSISEGHLGQYLEICYQALENCYQVLATRYLKFVLATRYLKQDLASGYCKTWSCYQVLETCSRYQAGTWKPDLPGTWKPEFATRYLKIVTWCLPYVKIWYCYQVLQNCSCYQVLETGSCYRVLQHLILLPGTWNLLSLPGTWKPDFPTRYLKIDTRCLHFVARYLKPDITMYLLSEHCIHWVMNVFIDFAPDY